MAHKILHTILHNINYAKLNELTPRRNAIYMAFPKETTAMIISSHLLLTRSRLGATNRT
jgi:hypothetical protein